MKDLPSIPLWPSIAAAGLGVIATSMWLAFPVSQPPATSLSEITFSPPQHSFLAESPAIIGKAEPSAADSFTPLEESDEQHAKEISRQAEIARKLTELRSELNAAAAITDLRKRNEILTRICYHWAEFDPRGAVALACDFNLEEAGILENLTQQWGSADLPAARAWVDTRPPSQTKERIAARIGFLMARTEPENAANYIIDEISPGEVQTEAAISVLHQWVQRDRKAAMAWAQKFPAGELRERAIRETSPAPVSSNAY